MQGGTHPPEHGWGGYYFYFRDGKLYYLGSTTGAEELFYTFYRGGFGI
ncbi:hypothetical protein [Thermococcus peptonophilus]